MNQVELQEWLQARLPTELLDAPPEIRVYPDEMVIVLQVVRDAALAQLDEAERSPAELQQIAERREGTRKLRMKLARELQASLGLSVAWGMRIGDNEVLFTTRTVPVMTRLGRAEREVLDTLVAAGVADTRSAALAYVVRAFAIEHREWLGEVREALTHIDKVRQRLKHTPRASAPPSGDEVG
ncbi:MAG: hypothetical protein HC828_01285 [Blastochloris sp.]|nr:hypothetical protein [Blastochloris sp.]